MNEKTIHYQTNSSITNKELIEKMLDGEAELEYFDDIENRWKTYKFPHKIRIQQPVIMIPDEVYLNIYANGKCFAHPSLKDAINSIDDMWCKSEFITVVFRKDYVP